MHPTITMLDDHAGSQTIPTFSANLLKVRTKMVETKVPEDELLVAEPDLSGLRRLQELGLLTPTGDGTLASSWTRRSTTPPSTTAAGDDGDERSSSNTSTNSNSSSSSSSSTEDDDRVRIDNAQGRVTYLNLGGKRLHRGLDAKVLTFFPALTTLNLGGTDLPAQNTVDILTNRSNSDDANNNPTTVLEHVYLGGNGLGDEGAQLLAGAWQKSPSGCCLPQSLRTLDLRYNDISGVGMAALCRAFLQASAAEDGASSCCAPNKLTAWHMEGNCIGDDGCRALAEWMMVLSRDRDRCSCCLEQLFLGANRIGPEGAKHLARALQANNNNSACSSNSKLTKLYLEGNHIGEEGAAALARALEHNAKSNNGDYLGVLKNLYVDNNNIGKEGSQRLARALNSATAIPDGI